jgi:hypothetical protein
MQLRDGRRLKQPAVNQVRKAVATNQQQAQKVAYSRFLMMK